MRNKANVTGRINLYDLSRQEVEALLAGWGYSTYHAERVWRYLYRQKVRSLAEMTDLRPDLRRQLEAEGYQIGRAHV